MTTEEISRFAPCFASLPHEANPPIDYVVFKRKQQIKKSAITPQESDAELPLGTSKNEMYNGRQKSDFLRSQDCELEAETSMILDADPSADRLQRKEESSRVKKCSTVLLSLFVAWSEYAKEKEKNYSLSLLKFLGSLAFFLIACIPSRQSVEKECGSVASPRKIKMILVYALSWNFVVEFGSKQWESWMITPSHVEGSPDGVASSCFDRVLEDRTYQHKKLMSWDQMFSKKSRAPLKASRVSDKPLFHEASSRRKAGESHALRYPLKSTIQFPQVTWTETNDPIDRKIRALIGKSRLLRKTLAFNTCELGWSPGSSGSIKRLIPELNSHRAKRPRLYAKHEPVSSNYVVGAIELGGLESKGHSQNLVRSESPTKGMLHRTNAWDRFDHNVGRYRLCRWLRRIHSIIHLHLLPYDWCETRDTNGAADFYMQPEPKSVARRLESSSTNCIFYYCLPPMTIGT